MIYFTSDIHAYHNREFLYRPRGFNSVAEMNSEIKRRWNNIVTDDDDVYILGDLMLNNNEGGMDLIRSLHGKLHIVRGNHDTDTRMELYHRLPNVVQVTEGQFFRYGKYHFYLTHFPCITSNLEKEKLSQCTINLFGHTHSKDKFYFDMPFMYNVAMDAHNCTPVSIEEALEDMRAKCKECKDML